MILPWDDLLFNPDSVARMPDPANPWAASIIPTALLAPPAAPAPAPLPDWTGRPALAAAPAMPAPQADYDPFRAFAPTTPAPAPKKAAPGLLGESFGMMTPADQQKWLDDQFARHAETTRHITALRNQLGQASSPYTRRALGAMLAAAEAGLPDINKLNAMRAGNEALPTKTALRAAAENVPAGFATAVLGVPEFAGIVKGYLSEGAVDDNALLKWSLDAKEKVKGAFPGDPVRQNDIDQQLATGLGQIASFYGTGALAALAKAGPKVLGALVATQGAAGSGSQGFEEATAKLKAARDAAAATGEKPTVDELDRILQTFGYAAIGTTEALPVASAFGRATGPTTRLGQRAWGALEGAAEEGLQEGASQLAQNVVARGTTDPTRDPGEGVVEGAVIGGLLGAGMGAAMPGPANPRVPEVTPTVEPPRAPAWTPDQPLSFIDLLPGSGYTEVAPTPALAAPPAALPAPAAPEAPASAEALPAAPTGPEGFWASVAPLDAALAGEEGQAITDWVGGPANARELGSEGGVMLPQRLENMAPAAQEAMAAPVRAALRSAYGPTVTVYRGESGGGGTTGRQFGLLSYTTDPRVAENIVGLPPEVPLVPAEAVRAAEAQLATAGEATVGRTTYRPNAYGSLDIYRNGQYVTDTPSIADDVASQNEYAQEVNARRAEGLKQIKKVELPVDSVVWATDRFGQKELIARNPEAASERTMEGAVFTKGPTIGRRGFLKGLAAVAAATQLNPADVRKFLATNPAPEGNPPMLWEVALNKAEVLPEGKIKTLLRDYLNFEAGESGFEADRPDLSPDVTPDEFRNMAERLVEMVQGQGNKYVLGGGSSDIGAQAVEVSPSELAELVKFFNGTVRDFRTINRVVAPKKQRSREEVLADYTRAYNEQRRAALGDDSRAWAGADEKMERLERELWGAEPGERWAEVQNVRAEIERKYPDVTRDQPAEKAATSKKVAEPASLLQRLAKEAIGRNWPQELRDTLYSKVNSSPAEVENFLATLNRISPSPAPAAPAPAALPAPTEAPLPTDLSAPAREAEPVPAERTMGGAVEARAPLRGFYSAAQRAAEALPEKMPIGQAIGWLRNQPGVKQAELDWLGLEEFAASGPKTKQELLNHIRANQAVLVEDTRQSPPEASALEAERLSLSEEFKAMAHTPLSREQRKDLEQRFQRNLAAIIALDEKLLHDKDAPKFKGRGMVGGANYRELLLQMPALKGTYTSPHYDSQELGHVRLDDRTGPNGERVLNIVELQSDLHQRGRKYGYKAPRAEVKKLEDQFEQKMNQLMFARQNGLSDEAIGALVKEVGGLKDKMYRMEGPNVSPNAPFKGTGWEELLMKKVLHLAAEEGYDAVSWARPDQTTGGEVMRTFYDVKLPQLANKLTKKWGGKVEEGQLSGSFKGNSTFNGPQTNNLVRITPAMRAAVLEGQPLHSEAPAPRAPEPEPDRPATQLPETLTAEQILQYGPQFTAAGRAVKLPTGLVEPMLDTIAANAQMLAAPTAVLTRVEPAGFNEKGDELIRTVYRDQDGQLETLLTTWKDISSLSGFYLPASGTLYFLSLDPAQVSRNRLTAKLWHETLHALRIQGDIPAADFDRLANHAETLGVLRQDYRDFAAKTQDPYAQEYESGVTVGEFYADLYDGRGDFDDLMAQEAVAHMLELYVHGALPMEAVAPIFDLLGNIESGAYVGRGAGADPAYGLAAAQAPAPAPKVAGKPAPDMPYWEGVVEEASALVGSPEAFSVWTNTFSIVNGMKGQNFAAEPEKYVNALAEELNSERLSPANYLLTEEKQQLSAAIGVLKKGLKAAPGQASPLEQAMSLTTHPQAMKAIVDNIESWRLHFNLESASKANPDQLKALGLALGHFAASFTMEPKAKAQLLEAGKVLTGKATPAPATTPKTSAAPTAAKSIPWPEKFVDLLDGSGFAKSYLVEDVPIVWDIAVEQALAEAGHDPDPLQNFSATLESAEVKNLVAAKLEAEAAYYDDKAAKGDAEAPLVAKQLKSMAKRVRTEAAPATFAVALPGLTFEDIVPAPARDYAFVKNAGGGTKPKELWKDAEGRQYMFKPVPTKDAFVAYAEVAGGHISSLLNAGAPKIWLQELNGRIGSMQEMIPNGGSLNREKLTDMSADDIATLMREHVVDWLISNHDGHANQFLRTEGGIVGIDKGQSYKYFGKDRLDINYHPNSVYGEQEPIYNKLWRAFAKGELTNYTDAVTGEVGERRNELEHALDVVQDDLSEAEKVRQQMWDDRQAAYNSAKAALRTAAKAAEGYQGDFEEEWERLLNKVREKVYASPNERFPPGFLYSDADVLFFKKTAMGVLSQVLQVLVDETSDPDSKDYLTAARAAVEALPANLYADAMENQVVDRLNDAFPGRPQALHTAVGVATRNMARIAQRVLVAYAENREGYSTAMAPVTDAMATWGDLSGPLEGLLQESYDARTNYQELIDAQNDKVAELQENIKLLLEELAAVEDISDEALYAPVDEAIDVLQDRLSDDDFLALLRPYAEKRFAQRPAGMHAFLDYALQRKRVLRETFHRFFLGLDEKRRRATEAMKNVSVEVKRAAAAAFGERHPDFAALSPREYSVLRAYTGGTYGSINKPMRSSTVKDVATGKLNPYWMNAATLQGILDTALHKLPAWSGTVYRGMSFGNPNEMLQHLVPGRIWRSPHALSTTYVPGQTFGGNIRLTIDQKSGRNVEQISVHPSEKEVLIPSNVPLLVAHVEKKVVAGKAEYHVYMVELPELDFNALEAKMTKP